jgi:hypothetical protein
MVFAVGIRKSMAASVGPMTEIVGLIAIRGISAALIQNTARMTNAGLKRRRRGAISAPSSPPTPAMPSIRPTSAEVAPPCLTMTITPKVRAENTRLIPAAARSITRSSRWSQVHRRPSTMSWNRLPRSSPRPSRRTSIGVRIISIARKEKR